MKKELLRKKILVTLAYFDIFEFPLTLMELRRYLWKDNVSLRELLEILDEMIRDQKLETKNGFYFLPKRLSIIEIRAKRYEISQKKWRRVKKYLFILRRLPFIKLIFVCNKLSYNNADTASDIDLLIITRKNRIWLARLLAVLVLGFLRIRRHGKKIRDRFCLSFYLAENSLDLSPLSQGEEDIHFFYWLYQLRPIVGGLGVYARFIEANSWLEKYLPTYKKFSRDFVFKKIGEVSRTKELIESIIDFCFGDQLEKISRFLQLLRMKRTSKKLGPGASVIVSDKILKFHPLDRRKFYREEFEKNLEKLGLDKDLDCYKM